MTSYIYDMVDTWNAGATTFTAVKMNVTDTASASGSLLMDLQVGGSSKFSVNKSGTPKNATNYYEGLGFYTPGTTNRSFIANTNGAAIVQSGYYSWGGAVEAGGAPDLILTRRAAANLRLGAADTGAVTSTVTITIAAPGVVTWTGHTLSTGTPVVFTTTGALPTGITAGTTYYAVVVDANTFQIASSVANAIATPATVITTSGTQSGTHTGTRYNITQRLGMQSVTGVTDRLGADLVIQGSQGTGTGAGGSIIFQVAPAGSSGTAQNALATALTIDSAKNAIFAGDILATGGSNFNTTGTNFSYNFLVSSGAIFGMGLYYVGLASNSSLRWSSTTNPHATPDIILARDDANKLALRNGANAQFLRVYSTYTDASNYERGAINTGADFVELAAETAGTGDDNLDVRLTPAGTGNVRFGTHTGTADTAVSGYIEIKDAGGTIRKLAVIT